MTPRSRARRIFLVCGSAIFATLLVATAIAVSPAYLGLGSVSSISQTSTTTSTGRITSTTNTVASAFANYLRVLASRNASTILRHFEGNANVTWTGRASGLTGIYVGVNTIGLLLNASFLTRSTFLNTNGRT